MRFSEILAEEIEETIVGRFSIKVDSQPRKDSPVPGRRYKALSVDTTGKIKPETYWGSTPEDALNQAKLEAGLNITPKTKRFIGRGLVDFNADFTTQIIEPYSLKDSRVGFSIINGRQYVGFIDPKVLFMYDIVNHMLQLGWQNMSFRQRDSIPSATSQFSNEHMRMNNVQQSSRYTVNPRNPIRDDLENLYFEIHWDSYVTDRESVRLKAPGFTVARPREQDL